MINGKLARQVMTRRTDQQVADRDAAIRARLAGLGEEAWIDGGEDTARGGALLARGVVAFGDIGFGRGRRTLGLRPVVLVFHQVDGEFNQVMNELRIILVERDVALQNINDLRPVQLAPG